MFTVITFGSATIDNYVDTYDRKNLQKAKAMVRYRHEIIYRTGDKILINDYNMSIGGGGTNTALTFSRFGLTTAFCGCLGKDKNSDIIKKWLDSENIAFVGHESDKGTGYSVILDSIEHDRTILTFKGANDELNFKKLILPNLEKAKLYYFSSLLNGSFETQKKLMKIAKKNNTKVAFNPSSYQAIKGKEYLKDILKNTNYLILNKEESQELLGTGNPHPKELLVLLRNLLDKDSLAIITDGARGAYLYNGIKFYHIIPNQIKVIESTGAGDAFASAFLGAMLKGEEDCDALHIAMANSQSVICHKGAKEKILTYEEAVAQAKKSKFKLIEL